jgi:hypothetical protein
MRTAFDIPLLRRPDLADLGIGPRRLAALIERRELTALRAGVYVWTSACTGLPPEDRVVLAARALALVSRRPPVIAGVTAAAVLGLPLHGRPDPRVHVVVGEDRPRTGDGVVRHRGSLHASELVRVGGLVCTDAARTAADVARSEPFAAAVCVADAALRAAADAGPGRYDLAADDAFRERCRAIVLRSARGRGRAARVLAFADGRAQRPGESISRIRLAELGFPRPELQVPVAGPGSRTYYVDFGLDGADAFGEFDGEGKYWDAHLSGGRDARQVFDAEKQREDWIRATTGRRFARWGWSAIRSAATLGDRLAAFRIHPPR